MALLTTATTVFAQDDLADNLVPTTPNAIDETTRQVLDYEPQLPDPVSTSSTLTEILARPEYLGDSVEEAQGIGMLERFFAWLERALGGLGVSGGSSTFGVVAITLLIGLVLFLLVRLLWDMFGGRRFTAGPKRTGTLENLSSVDLVGLATKAAAKGDYQQAIRLRFKAVLGGLRMPASAVLTNTQVLRRLKRNMPFAAAPFGEIATIFEDTWYGQQPSTKENYKHVSECAGRIEQGLEGLEE